jgi:hypothetical protein
MLIGISPIQNLWETFREDLRARQPIRPGAFSSGWARGLRLLGVEGGSLRSSGKIKKHLYVIWPKQQIFGDFLVTACNRPVNFLEFR